MDAADFKSCVFPLLFFKRLSDVHDEEYQTALDESGGDEEYAHFPQNYSFQVPEDCHWRDVRAVSVNVGQALQKALRGIEQANPETLYGIFGDAQWTNNDAAVPGLSRNQAYLLDFIVPSSSQTEQFEEIVVPIFGQLRNLWLKYANLRQTRDLLLPKLVSGEVERLEISGVDSP